MYQHFIRPALLVLLTVGLFAGCKKGGPPSTSSSTGGPEGASTETVVAIDAKSSVQPYLDYAGQALDAEDYELASMELQGALSLAQAAHTQQRQADAQVGRARESQPAVDLAAKHLERAKAAQADKQWDAAAAHYNTGAALLRIAADRESRRIGALATAFNNEYNAALEEVRKWHEDAVKEAESDPAKTESVQAEYAKKNEELQATWNPKREEHNAKVEELRKEVDAKQVELTKQRCQAFAGLAEVYKAKGDERQAQYYAGAAHQELARTLERTGDFAGAQTEYEKWRESAPEDLSAVIGLANVLSQQDKPDEAAAVYRDLLKKKPDDVNARSQLAALLARQQKWEDAEAQWKAVLASDAKELGAIQGNDPAAQARKQQVKRQIASHHWQLGDIRRQAGKQAEAKQSYAKAVQLNPDLANAVPEGYR